MIIYPGQPLFGGRYIIETELGKGGMGITFLARNRRGELRVIKTFREDFFNNQAWIPYRDKLRYDFCNEALRLSLCRHPHIVQMENVFDEGDFPCMAMEYIKGEDLGKRIKEKGVLPEAEALIYIRQIGNALTLVHERGLLHRDLKPSNIIMRTGKPEAVLIDFGIARQFIPGANQKLTVGYTPGYAPPEQYSPEVEAGEYIDVYALAATLYHLLAGFPPIVADQRQKFTLRPPKDFNPSVSNKVNQAIMRGMALNYKYRPQSIPEWLDLLGVNFSSSDILTPIIHLEVSTRSTSDNLKLLPVHEFSDGTKPVRNHQGKWVSGGLTGNFNNINHPIPDEIKIAFQDPYCEIPPNYLYKNYFKIPHTYPPKNNEVALIGCNLKQFSVLVVAKRTEDYCCRSFVACRYFWLENSDEDIDGVGSLLVWWFASGQPQLEFIPTTSSSLNYMATACKKTYFHRYERAVVRFLSQTASLPLILALEEISGQPHHSVMPLHCLALHLQHKFKYPLCWAWNVRSLEHPKRFLVICCADKSDELRLQRVINK